MAIYDISVPITHRTPVYPGDPGIEIRPWAAISRGDAANVSLLHFGAHTGTHVDAPAHFIEGGGGAGALPLDVLVGPALVVEVSIETQAIDARELSRHNLNGVTRVLFKTRNSSFWKSQVGFRGDYTFIASDAARLLVERGVRLVGIDYLSVEQFKATSFETHFQLLLNDVVIIEGLDLSEVSAGHYELICLPLKIMDGSGDGAPARAILRTIENGSG